ncbi:MAG TPA: response regulator [Pyrinomonadaceae bacterium]|nr:response regulator [Pyrinomonadaceae bacterium]
MGDLKTVIAEPGTVHCSIEDEAQTVSLLHIEDDDIVAAVTREMLEAQGWQVDCGDGNAAVEKISGDARYDFLLVDYDLPELNGLELVDRARKLAHRSSTPIGVLSANQIQWRQRHARPERSCSCESRRT